MAKKHRYVLYSDEVLYDKKFKEYHFVPMDLASEHGFILIPDKGSKEKRDLIVVLFEECDIVKMPGAELPSILYGRV